MQNVHSLLLMFNELTEILAGVQVQDYFFLWIKKVQIGKIKQKGGGKE